MKVLKDNLTAYEYSIYLGLQEKSKRNLEKNSLNEMESYTKEEILIKDKVFQLMKQLKEVTA